VPWTTPGGTPCCCEEPDSCVSNLVSSLGVSIADFLRIDLTSEQYAAIKAGATFDYLATMTLSGTGPGGAAISSYFPNPITVGTTISFTNCRGNGANNQPGLGGINSFPLLVLVTSGGIPWSYGASYDFFIILQAAGQGVAGDAPLTSPAMYLYGVIASVTRGSTHAINFTIASAGSTVGTLFGQSIKAIKSVTGGTDASLSVSMTFSAP
jgi:hypothetical protein